MSSSVQVFYVIVTLFVAAYLTFRSRTKDRFVTFMTSFWIMANSILSSDIFVIRLSMLPFDLQPRRILFLSFLFYLVLLFFKTTATQYAKEKMSIIKYEFVLYLYILASIIVAYMHIRAVVSGKDFVLMNVPVLSFIIIYLVLKRTTDFEMLRVLVKSYLILCTVSSVIGIIQFTVIPGFLRMGEARVAFGGFSRAEGVFYEEYTQSYFLIVGVILVLFFVRHMLLRRALLGLYGLGVLFTFHRMSWIALFVLVLLYFVLVRRGMSKIMVMGAAAGVLLLCVVVLFSSQIQGFKSSSLYEQRFTDETMKVRMNIYKMIFRNIHRNWLIGFGTRDSDMYYYGMLEARAGRAFATGERGGIHNGFLEVMFFKGVIVVALYILFFIFVLDYFHILAKTKHIVFYIAIFEVLKFVMANLTNAFTLGTSLGFLLAMVLGISTAINIKGIYTENAFLDRIAV